MLLKILKIKVLFLNIHFGTMKKKNLIKFEFVNPKDKKVVTGIRNDLENN